MIIDNEFNIGDFVYLKTDTDQLKRIVTGIFIRKDSVIYDLSVGDSSSNHYGIEISYEKDVEITIK